MKEEDILNEIYDSYSEWIEMLSGPQAVNFVIEQLARRVVEARQEATRYKMALKRKDLIAEER